MIGNFTFATKGAENITAPNLPQPALDTHLNDLQKQWFSANHERNSC